MSSFNRKLKRNKIKDALKKQKQKQIVPLSKYRMRTDKEKKELYAQKLTEMMLNDAKKQFKI